MQLDQKVAMITGASSGIGAGISKALAAKGVKVGLAARRVDKLVNILNTIEDNGGEGTEIEMDVTDKQSVESGARHLLDAYGQIDILVNNALRKSLRNLPMYQIGGNPAFILDTDSNKTVTDIFEKIIKEVHSNYRFKYNLIRNYIIEVIYTALKLEPSEKLYTDINANTRITGVFMELLERQFPIESRSQQFKMNKARDFAQQLSIHRNHLNRAVKKTTGKTTTDIIYNRIITEAKALLKHTNWNISEIGFSLGYDEPSHFNHFFRSQTNSKPSDYRQ